MSILKVEENQLVHIADILLGAAHADQRYDGSEATAIADILESLVKGHLPAAVKARFDAFEPDDFNVADACADLHFNASQRNALFSLIGQVIEADDIFDFDESAYLHQVADAIGATKEELEPYLVNFIEVVPPPVP